MYGSYRDSVKPLTASKLNKKEVPKMAWDILVNILDLLCINWFEWVLGR
jgi:hypothetical protein